jgi:flagellin-like protein
MKGISPIIASVLLIAITMSIAVVLAAYVTSYTRQATASIPSACIGGALFISGNPKCTSGTLKVTVEGQFVKLSTFTIDVRDATTKAFIKSVVASGNALAPGDIGELTATLGTDCTTSNEIRVSTDCFNVKTDWAAIT